MRNLPDWNLDPPEDPPESDLDDADRWDPADDDADRLADEACDHDQRARDRRNDYITDKLFND